MSTYTPLTPEQFSSAQKAGYSVDQIIANEKVRKSQSGTQTGTNFQMPAPTGNNFGFPTPSQDTLNTYAKSQSDTLDSAGNIANNIFPNRNLGAVLGTGAGYVATAVTNPKALPFYDTNPHTSVGGVLGDIGGDVINAGSLLAAPETLGTSLSARSLISGGLGAGLSVAGNVSNGKSITDPQVWHDAINTGTVSAILPILGEPFSAINAESKNIAIDPRTQSILKESTPEEVKSYIKAAQTHATQVRDPITGASNPSAFELAKSKVQDASDILANKISVAGQAVGDAKAGAGALNIGTNPETGESYADNILSHFNQRIENDFGHTIEIPRPDTTSIKINGEKVNSNSFSNEAPLPPEITPVKGSLKTLPTADQKKLLAFHSQLTALAENPTVGRASDVVHNLDSEIDWEKLQQVGSKDHLDSFLADIRGQLNHNAIRPSAPDLATANDVFSNLKSKQDDFLGLVGSNLDKSEVPLARVASGDKAGPIVNTFNDVKNITGVDLQKEAHLAKFATDNFGSETAKSLLQQRINEGANVVGGYKRALLGFVKKNTIGQFEPDVEKFAADLARGSSKSTGGLLGSIKDFIKPPQYQGFLDQLATDPKARNLISDYALHFAKNHSYVGGNLLNAGKNVASNIIRSLTPNSN